MPPQVRRLARDDYEMSGTDRDLLLASRAQVDLARLEGVDQPHLHLVFVAVFGTHTADSGRDGSPNRHTAGVPSAAIARRQA